jgi:hypothetical protein
MIGMGCYKEITGLEPKSWINKTNLLIINRYVIIVGFFTIT